MRVTCEGRWYQSLSGARLLRKLAVDQRAERAQKRSSAASAVDRAPAARPVLSTGSQLMREWNGSTEIVDVIRDGFSWRGKDYRTLSAVAVAITATKWSGPKFFGLVPPTSTRTVRASRQAVRTALNVVPGPNNSKHRLGHVV